MTDTEAMQLAGLVLRQWPNSGWGDETIAAFIVEMSKIGAEYETARQAVMSLRLRDTWQTVAVGSCGRWPPSRASTAGGGSKCPMRRPATSA